jgi:glycosyltransferase involved in cell wall biosynthesis
LNIIYATAGWSPHDRRFIAAILAQGHKVWFSSADDSVVLTNEWSVRGAAMWPFSQRNAGCWNEQISQSGVNVVHAGPLTTVAANLSQNIAAPFVAMSWGSDVLQDAANCSTSQARAIASVRRADVILGDCAAVIDEIHRWIPDFETPYIEFPWGLELHRFDPLPVAKSKRLRARLAWQDATVLISTRSLEPNYGIANLVAAFSEVAQEDTTLRLILAGDGSLRDSIVRDIERRGLGGYVTCPGRLDEKALPIWYGAADLYVSASRCDGSSISLLEAMACGLPVIVHERYGNREWVDEGENGWMTNCLDIGSIAQSLRKSIAARDAWKAMGRLGRERVFDRADWTSNSKKLGGAYELAVARYRLRT